MVAAVGLQVAVDEGDDFVALAQLHKALRGLHADAGAGVRLDLVGADAVVDDRDARGKRLGEQRRLPLRGRDARMCTWKVQLVVGVFHLQAAGIVGLGCGKLRIKACVCALGLVEKLAIDAQAGLGPDLLQEQAFAPTGVGHDHVGHKALFAKLHCGLPSGFAAQGFDLQVGQPAVRALAGTPRDGIAHQFYARHRLAGIDVQGHHAVALACHGRGQVLELPRKVLVDEKDVHGSWSERESSHAAAQKKFNP